MRLFVVTFKHCVASFLKVCSRQPFAGHRCQKRDKNSAPTLDCLHGGIPHLVLRFGLYHVRLQHDSRLRCGCGYSPTLQLYHHDRVRKNTKRFLSFQKKSTKPKNWFSLNKKVPISVLTFSSSANVNYNLVFNSFVLVVFSFYQEMVAQTIKEVIVGREEYMAAPAPGETTNATETT